MPAARDIFGQLIERMRAEIQAVRRAAAEVLQAGDYNRARTYMEQAEDMEVLLRRAGELREAWTAVIEGRRRGKGRRRRRESTPTQQRKRVTPGRKLVAAAILQALREKGGQATSEDVIYRVRELIGELLPPGAYEIDPHSGAPKWERAVHWERLQLRQQGYISPDSPRGIWAITPEGERWLEENPLAQLIDDYRRRKPPNG